MTRRSASGISRPAGPSRPSSSTHRPGHVPPRRVVAGSWSETPSDVSPFWSSRTIGDAEPSVLSGNPVAARPRRRIVRTRHDVDQLAAMGLDHADRTNVVVVAGDDHALEAEFLVAEALGA